MARLVMLALGVLLLFPTAARAGGTVAVDGPRLVFTGTPGVDTVGVFALPASGELSVEQIGLDGSLGPQVAGAGCKRESHYGDVVKTYCPAAGITEIVAGTGDGDDRVVLGVAIPARVDAGAGDDQVDNYGGVATIQLGAGDDVLLTDKTATTTAFGGAGDDDLSCSDDRFNRFKDERTYDGGAGKDRLCGARGDDRLDGGRGDERSAATRARTGSTAARATTS